ncbi:MAG: SRPBCC domain-containing protein [Polyangiales bacterium]
MPLESIEVSATVPASPDEVWALWMSTKGHSAFTGAAAVIAPQAGHRHTAWDGYIHGWVLKVGPGRRATFAWRTSEFAPSDVDSLVFLTVARAPGGARVRLEHIEIPEGQGARYRQGWDEFYVQPLLRHLAATRRPTAKKKPVVAKKPAAKARATTPTSRRARG